MTDREDLIAEAREAAETSDLYQRYGHLFHRLADALEAAPVVDREALIATLVGNREAVAGSARDYVDSEATADLILSSGILLDRAEVEARALESVADEGADRG